MLNIDDIPTVQTPSPVKQDDVLYAANLAGGDVVDNYVNAKQEIAMTGDSALVNNEKSKWLQEQVDTNHKTVEEMISDETLPMETRRKVMEAYVQGAIPLQDLRDKFLVDRAVQDTTDSVEDTEQQNEHSATVIERDIQKQDEVANESIAKGTENIGSIIQDATKAALKTGATIGSGLALSIPAGLVGAFTLLTEQNPDKAADIIKTIEGYAYQPDAGTKSGEASAVITNMIGEAIQGISYPIRWLADKKYQQVVDMNKEYERMGIRYRADPALAATGVIATATLASFAIAPAKPAVKPLSPIGTVVTASKEQGANLAAKALEDKAGIVAEAFGTTKDEIVNTYVLPKLKDEFGPMHPDARVALEKMDEALNTITRETEISPHVYPATQIRAEREAYTKILTEVERPHLLLSSSVLDLSATEKLFGRSKKGREALVNSSATKLEGTAVFGRNANFGYKSQAGATKYMKKLQEDTKHLPDQGTFEILERDKQFYVSWKFQRDYVPLEHMAFGADTLSAHFLSKNIDITNFANSDIGKHIWPAYMRMKEDIPAQGAAAAREEGRIESIFLQEARDTFMKTDKPKELSDSLLRGEDEGRVFTIEDIQNQHPHLKKAEVEKLHFEYAAYRRLADHLYSLSDRKYRKNLVDKGMKTLYNNNGEFVAHTSEVIAAKDLPNTLTHVLDLEKQTTVKLNKDLPVVMLDAPVKVGDHIHNYAHLPVTYQHGPIRAGALPQIPGYIPRYYKEWFVVDSIPKDLYVDGVKATTEVLEKNKSAVAMAGTKPELEAMMEKLQKENPDTNYSWRKEEKDINDKIIHDSHVYDTYLKQIHRRGGRLPSLNRKAQTEDVLVAMTKAIRSTAKVVAWDDLSKVRRDNFVKAYGDFTDHKFPDQINKIHPKEHMTPQDEHRFLAAQSVYSQFEIEQISSVRSDLLWKNGMNKVADAFEGATIDAQVIRQWGEAGFVPARLVKAWGSHMWLYWRALRQLVIQPQQWKELAIVSPAYAKSLSDVFPIMQGLMARTHTLRPLKIHADNVGKRVMKDYDRVMDALEESAILQTVDMNQMVHGIWKDAAQELNPKQVKSVLDVTEKAIKGGVSIAGFPGKVGRAVGYNVGELTNQVTLWLYARHRWMEKHPGKNWDTLENRAQIARDQSIYSNISATRAGMFSWQEGSISTFTQFVAIPWKSTLQMVSLKSFSGPEKARLAAARLFWYGKYGLPMGAGIYKLIERNVEDKEDRELINKLTVSATDRVWNTVLGSMFDVGNENTSVDTKNLSTVIEGDYIWDTISAIVDMTTGKSVDIERPKFPFENAGSSLFEAARTIHDIFGINEKGALDLDTWKAASWKAVSFAGQLSDFNKALLLEGMSKSGNAVGYEQTRGEAIARLFGIPPKEEALLNMANLPIIKRQKEIKSTAKQIHQRLISVLQATSVDEKDKQAHYLDGLHYFLQGVPESYKKEIINEVFKQDRYSWKEKKQSILLYLYKNAMDESDKHYQDLRNILEQSNDQEVQTMLKELDGIKIRGIK